MSLDLTDAEIVPLDQGPPVDPYPIPQFGGIDIDDISSEAGQAVLLRAQNRALVALCQRLKARVAELESPRPEPAVNGVKVAAG